MENSELDNAALPRLNARVLLAEDNPVNQMLAEAMLSKLGCRVQIAVNGKEAVRCYGETEYDIVLMDCHMPEVDGYQAAVAIRALERERVAKRVPIIAVTADVTAGVRDICLKAGMDDYLSKPFGLSALGAVMQRWLDAAPKNFN